MFHHHEMFSVLTFHVAAPTNEGGKKVKEKENRKKNCKAKKNWKMCKNKVVNQYECPVVI